MNGVDAFFFRECDDAVDIQIRLNGPFALADLISFVGFETMQTETVFGGINRDRFQSKLSRSTHDANSNFTTIQRKKFFHGE